MMNKSVSLIEKITSLFENQAIAFYDQTKGIKLIRYGNPHNRFDSDPSFHYNSPPVKTGGTWCSVFPHNMILSFPAAHDNGRHLDLTDQSALAKQTYGTNHGTGMMSPTYFSWTRDIYSHIDRQGNYNNKGWIYYKTAKELYQTIVNNASRLQQSVNQVKAKSQNVHYPDSDIRYFQNHEFECFIPHVEVSKLQ